MKTKTAKKAGTSKPPKPVPVLPKGSTCRAVRRILDSHKPNSNGWRRLSIWYGENC